MLANYGKNQSDVVQRIRDALYLGDYASAEGIAHSTKGLSGNIGATELQKMAAELEAMIRANHTLADIEEKLRHFEQVQANILLELNNAMSIPTLTQVKKEGKKDIDLTQAPIKMANLKALLAEQDHTTGKFFEQNSALFETTLGAELFILVRRDIKHYDFDQAIERLTAITK